MRFEVDTGARRRTIDVQRSGSQWVVTVDGRALSASLAQAGVRWTLLVGPASPAPAGSAPAAGRSYEIAVESRGRGEHVVSVDGHGVAVSILDSRRRGPRGRVGSGDAGGPATVVSPMPGRVVKVLVARGDLVAAHQGLVVVEAMKMENELRAPRAGTVTEVRVREGEPVEAHAVLMVIEAGS